MSTQATRQVFASDGWEVDLGRRELRARGAPVPLGSRAFDILEALVRYAGDLVTKQDLMDRVWAGQIVEENTLQVHISAIRKALGDDRDLLRTASGRGYRLLGKWVDRGGETQSARPSAAIARPRKAFLGNLPAGPLELVGREGAARQVRDLVSAYRLVTLTGPGGIGKTKLALEVARSVAPDFEGDAWLVELASIADGNLVASAVAATLDLDMFGGEISPRSLAQAIGTRKLLLLLDSCEHVVAEAAALAETVLRLCPAVSILATSRETLRTDGEGIYAVPPLQVPAVHEPAEDVPTHSAAQLFIARTRALRSDFAPRAAELPTIGAICRRLDGIPLAIELAAARAATLGLDPVLSRLNERFALLTAGRRTAVSRHKTLRAALDWSYDLLPESEQRLLRVLAIFAAGFTTEAAAAVMGAAGDAASPVMDGIFNLITKSLVTIDGTGTDNRWRLLETTRAYALEKLGESGEAALAARRHAEFFRDLVAPDGVFLDTRVTEASLARAGREIDNVRAALDWACSPAGDLAIGAVLAAAYMPVWLHLELLAECRERCERALDGLEREPSLHPALRMQLLIALGVALTFTLGAVARTRAVLEKALALAQELDDLDGQLRTLWCLSALDWDIGDTHASLAVAENFLRVARRTEDSAFILVGERLVGTTLHTAGRQDAARERFQHVLERYVAPRDRPHTIWFQFDQRVLARTMLARVLCLQGFLDRAGSQMRESLRESEAVAHAASELYALFFAGFPVALMTGDLAAAQEAVARMIDVATRHNAPYWRNLGHCIEGRLLIARGEFADGAERLRAALDTCDRSGWTVNYPEFLGTLAEGLAGLGQFPAAFAAMADAQQRAEAGGERWYLPELLRLEGEMRLRESGIGAGDAAEVCLARALALAREQGALLWELRAAESLARLRLRRDRPVEARALLAPVYERFSEGFEAADLRSARTLLAALPTA